MASEQKTLNFGLGQCQATERLVVYVSPTALSLGALGDVMQRILAVVHHANRQANLDDFIAVALPGMNKGARGVRSGKYIELLATSESLEKLMKQNGFQLLLNRQMIRQPFIDEPTQKIGELGCAWCRDRSSEKYTPGWIKRSRARAARRGIKISDDIKARNFSFGGFSFVINQAVVAVVPKLGIVTNKPLMVSTYGFSRKNNPAHLPVIVEKENPIFSPSLAEKHAP